MDKENKLSDKVDLLAIAKKIYSRKMLFLKVWVVTFILSCIYILPQPRIYTSELMLVPETGGTEAGGSLSSLASSFGLSLGGMEGGDAFFPEIYPDVIATNEFLVGLFDAQVETEDGEVKTDYYTYLTEHQSRAFYSAAFSWMKNTLKNLVSGPQEGPEERSKINPNHLDQFHNALVLTLKDNISCQVSKMTNVITITVDDQDPQVAAIIADTVRVKLQSFITEYKTQKARQDAEYYGGLMQQAKKEYEVALNAYSRYCDTHRNAVLQAYQSERDFLENDLTNKLSAYNALSTQYQAADAKVQERTPSFTTLQRPSVPLKPTKPKRMIFVAFMLCLATFATATWIMRKEFVRWF